MDVVVLALAKKYTDKTVKEASMSSVNFGTPTATAEQLPSDSEPTVEVSSSGPDSDKVFSFDFGIPQGKKGESPVFGVDYWTEEQKEEMENQLVENADFYTKDESDARYAPIEAAIKVSGKGTGLVSLSPTVAWGMQGLKLYGRSWQDGIPSVETEVPIQDAGQDGQVDLTVCGANLANPSGAVPSPIFSNGVTIVNNNGVISVSGTPTNTAGSVFTYYFTGELSLPKGWYFAKDCNVKTSKNGSAVGYFQPNTSFFFDPDLFDSARCYVQRYPKELADTGIGIPYKDGEVVYPALFSGQTTQLWQPYTAQQLPIPTPDGLPGIPVTSGGNWVDENGQQWVSDVVDLVAGTLTRHCGQIASYNSEEINTPYISSTGALTTGAQVVYALSEPITTPLDAETIAAYRALQSYPGTTNVLASDAGIEASAIGNTTEIVNQKINTAITQAVTLAQGG